MQMGLPHRLSAPGRRAERPEQCWCLGVLLGVLCTVVTRVLASPPPCTHLCLLHSLRLLLCYRDKEGQATQGDAE